MEPPKLFLLHVLLFFLFSATVSSSFSPPTTTSNTTAKSTTPSPSPSNSSSSTLDPKQLRALQYLNVSTTKNPCFQPASTTCDDSTPFRHLLSLHLSSCSDHTHISTTVLKSLDSLTSFSLLNCPISSPHFPTKLATNLRSFTCINSFRKLTGVFLSRLTSLTDLTVSGVTITASGLSIFLAPMKSLNSLTISDTHLTGYLPKRWHLNLTHIDLSRNSLGGKIPTSLTSLENLQHLNLSSNNINGKIPDSVGELLVLKNLSLASNSLSGAIPDSISAMQELLHLDLSTNQLNGTVPKSIAEMKNLKYLSLESNKFHGVMPFNESFIKSLIVFKIGGNSDLCYNQSKISSKLKLEISPCDKNGFPISPPPAKDSLKDGSSSRRVSDSEDDDEVKSERKTDDHKGPNKVVLGVAIGLSSIVFVIVFLVLLSKWCG